MRWLNRNGSHLHGHGAGDEYAEIIISVPKKLTSSQRELLKEFEKENNKKGFFKKVFDKGNHFFNTFGCTQDFCRLDYV